MAEPTIDRWLTPRAVLRVVLALVLVTLLLEWLAPAGRSGERATSLTSYSYEPGGVRGLYETLERLGWRVERRELPLRGALDTIVVYVVMQPQVDLTAAEVGSLLDAVRRGAALLFVPATGSTLADSLKLEQSEYSPYPLPVRPPRKDESEDADAEDDGLQPANQRSDDGGGPLARRRLTYHYALRPRAPLSSDTVGFLYATADSRPVILGIPLGRGRLIAVADPSLFRNFAVREANGGVLPVRLVEWLAHDTSRVVFDEFHQGFGHHASVGRAVRRALAYTPSGRMLLQLMGAALLLLIALSVRPIAPRPRLRTERRSPFEHVGALARAYEQIGATRLAARRLIRGLRRRHALATAGDDDEAALRRLAARYPALKPDIERLLDAATRRLPPDQFRQIADSIATMERTLAT
jgi:hypothetical protein